MGLLRAGIIFMVLAACEGSSLVDVSGQNFMFVAAPNHSTTVRFSIMTKDTPTTVNISTSTGILHKQPMQAQSGYNFDLDVSTKRVVVLSTDADVNVLLFGETNHTSSATVLLPTNLHQSDSEYMVTTYKPNIAGYATFVRIGFVENATVAITLKFTPSSGRAVYNGSTFYNGDTFRKTFPKYAWLSLEGVDIDVTGTHIHAVGGIVVFTGALISRFSPDTSLTQNFPVSESGVEYYVPPVDFFSTNKTIIRMVALHDNTKVTTHGETFTINRGEFADKEFGVTSLQKIVADKPIQVSQIIDMYVSLVTLPPVNKWSRRATLTTDPSRSSYDEHIISIVGKTSELNGVNINGQQLSNWNEVASYTTGLYTAKLIKVPPSSYTVDNDNFSNARMMVTVFGKANASSYAFVANIQFAITEFVIPGNRNHSTCSQNYTSADDNGVPFVNTSYGCSTNALPNFTDIPVESKCETVIQRVWTWDDACDGTYNETQIIKNVPPRGQTTCPNETNIPYGTPAPWGPDITGNVSVSGCTSTSISYTDFDFLTYNASIVRRFSITDGCGMNTTCEQLITVATSQTTSESTSYTTTESQTPTTTSMSSETQSTVPTRTASTVTSYTTITATTGAASSQATPAVTVSSATALTSSTTIPSGGSISDEWRWGLIGVGGTIGVMILVLPLVCYFVRKRREGKRPQVRSVNRKRAVRRPEREDRAGRRPEREDRAGRRPEPEDRAGRRPEPEDREQSNRRQRKLHRGSSGHRRHRHRSQRRRRHRNRSRNAQRNTS